MHMQARATQVPLPRQFTLQRQAEAEHVQMWSAASLFWRGGYLQEKYVQTRYYNTQVLSYGFTNQNTGSSKECQVK